MKSLRPSPRWILLLITLLVLLYGVVYPNLQTFSAAMQSEGHWSLSTFVETLSQRTIIESAWTSILLSVLTVALCALVGVPLARVHASASPDAEIVDQLPAGVRVMTLEREGDWRQIGHDRYLRDRDTVGVMALPQRHPTPADLVATAESFLDVPYLWGGTSGHGIDCSGLTQQVYRLNGVGLDRDADQQALGGRTVDVARPGDLFFFGKDRVTHTAIATGECTFIHAPQSGQRVQRGELPGASPLRATRRYLP
jgi:hypothetical protein